MIPVGSQAADFGYECEDAFADAGESGMTVSSWESVSAA